MDMPKLRELRRWWKLGPGFLDARKKILDKQRWTTTIEEVVPGILEDYSADKVNIIGHSFGGMVGLNYALDHPENVADVVTVASAFHGTKGIYWQNVMRLAGLYDERLYDQLLPQGRYVQGLRKKIDEQWQGMNEHLVHVFNIIAGEDEFVRPSEMSLESLVGKSKALSETTVPEGHCEALFHPKTYKNMMFAFDNEFPTIGLAPIFYDSHIFDEVRQQLSYEQNQLFICIDYDFATVTCTDSKIGKDEEHPQTDQTTADY